MNLRSFFMPLVGGVCVIPLVLGVAAMAQDEDLGSLAGRAQTAMKAEQWADALALYDSAVTRFGGDHPLGTFGPQFGAIHYHKGTCEMRLKRWDEAMRSFEICYRDFPNAVHGSGSGNIFHKMALLKWGEAAMGAQDWQLAIRQFQKFLKERDRERDIYPQGPFHVSMAVCQYRLGRIPEGNESLEIAIRNKHGFPTPDTGIVAGFQTLVSAVIASRNEQALLDFIGKNRGELMIEPFAMHHFAHVYLKLAGDAVGADMQRAAMELYQFVPSTDAVLDDIRARLKSMAGLESVKDGADLIVRKQLEADLAELENERRGGDSAEMVKLAGTALLHEKNGNLRGAFAAYQQLELYYPLSEKREDNLANLVRTSSLVATGAETRRHAGNFLKTFPDSPHLPTVRRMMLSTLFDDGDYAACIEVAAPMLDKLEAGTPEHDLCLYVLGASCFHTGQYDKARPLLDQHVEKYPKSVFALPAAYFRASNVYRKQDWRMAAGLLDDFLTRFPDPSENIYLPFALSDRAACRFAEQQPERAIEDLDRVITGFPDCQLIDQAYLLKGRIEQSLGNLDKAEMAWLKALQTAETRGNRGIAGESLASLIGLLAAKADPARRKDVVGHADHYWKAYAKDSPFRTRVAIAQVSALEWSGRGDDVLGRLRETICDAAKDPAGSGLDELIRTYKTAYLRKHSPEDLRNHFHGFPGIAADDRIVRPRLHMAVIEVFEKTAAETKDEARKTAATTTIKTLYQEMKTGFATKDLDNFILVKIGDHLRLGTSTPREALPYYDEVIGREDVSHRIAALLGRADVFSESTMAADLDKAVADFKRVATESADKAGRDYAESRIAGLEAARRERDSAGK